MSCACPLHLFGQTRSLAPVRHRLFVSPCRPFRALSKNVVSFFLREVIHAAGVSRPEVGSVRAHEIRGVSTSVAFHRNWSVSAVLESATWSQVWCFPLFTCATFSMNTMAFACWVRSWLRVRGSSSPHLFLTCSGGGGGATSPLSPLLRGSCTCLSFWLCGLPIQLLCRFWSTPLFLFCFSFYVFYFTFFVSYIYLFGVVLYGHMT